MIFFSCILLMYFINVFYGVKWVWLPTNFVASKHFFFSERRLSHEALIRTYHGESQDSDLSTNLGGQRTIIQVSSPEIVNLKTLQKYIFYCTYFSVCSSEFVGSHSRKLKLALIPLWLMLLVMTNNLNWYSYNQKWWVKWSLGSESQKPI